MVTEREWGDRFQARGRAKVPNFGRPQFPKPARRSRSQPMVENSYNHRSSAGSPNWGNRSSNGRYSTPTLAREQQYNHREQQYNHGAEWDTPQQDWSNWNSNNNNNGQGWGNEWDPMQSYTGPQQYPTNNFGGNGNDWGNQWNANGNDWNITNNQFYNGWNNSGYGGFNSTNNGWGNGWDQTQKQQQDSAALWYGGGGNNDQQQYNNWGASNNNNGNNYPANNGWNQNPPRQIQAAPKAASQRRSIGYNHKSAPDNITVISEIATPELKKSVRDWIDKSEHPTMPNPAVPQMGGGWNATGATDWNNMGATTGADWSNMNMMSTGLGVGDWSNMGASAMPTMPTMAPMMMAF
eukprot:TRINITY_DN67138_c11_g6_i1.p1 TRINITY_DN67138_c11_g6~~TRINITY_DN67138_c11_g6_i1.p1  ORF type:complete len:351 (+),score=76.91 TRINITY_DN67138_c11_g6_i1:32-1084(+)